VLNDCAAVSAYLEWEILTLDCWIHVSDMEHCMVFIHLQALHLVCWGASFVSVPW
jgi:hypothetical protein